VAYAAMMSGGRGWGLELRRRGVVEFLERELRGGVDEVS